MAPRATGSVRGSDRTAMERFGGGGMALLPWTKQMLTVLWEQLRLLVQIIYYTFVSVFQMFRFEVHVRITDETGQHIQHMTSATNAPESFLFSSLFDGDSGVMVGGSNPLTNFCAEVGDPFPGPSSGLLSGLRADDLCCGLVDDFVSRAGGHQANWKMGFPADWNIFVSSSDGSGSERQEAAKDKTPGRDASEEERSFTWSSEEDQGLVEFDSEESKALWESLSKSSDPYNPFFFSACISTSAAMGKSKSQSQSQSQARDGGDVPASPGEELRGPLGLNVWVSRSDSESSWGSSDGSSPDLDREENERLWEFFSRPADPYDPLCFTASTLSASKPRSQAAPPPPASLPAPPEDDDDEEERLWKSLSRDDDPYHPLNFKAQQNRRAALKPPAPPRRSRPHCHRDHCCVPWKKKKKKKEEEEEEEDTQTIQERQSSTVQKKVRFSPVVEVHVMRSWPFATQASRKGPWEELARDRHRFRRRIEEAERAVGPCLGPAHREKRRSRSAGPASD